MKIGDEVKENLKAWLHRNFVHAKAGRIGSFSYERAGAFDDHRGDGPWYSDAYERALLDHTEPLTGDEIAFLVKNPLIAFQMAAGITDLRGLRCFRRGLTQRINSLQQKAYRARYYARDNVRRRLLAAERRKITRRKTVNPCPTAETFRAAFAQVKDSLEAKIRFGGMVHDLECYVDNCLRIDEKGEIVGRNGGIKAWLTDNVPELAPRYKTIMRYKALAKRLRQAAEIQDPVPTDVLLGKTENNKIYYAEKSHSRMRGEVKAALGGVENTLVAAFRWVDGVLESGFIGKRAQEEGAEKQTRGKSAGKRVQEKGADRQTRGKPVGKRAQAKGAGKRAQAKGAGKRAQAKGSGKQAREKGSGKRAREKGAGK